VAAGTVVFGAEGEPPCLNGALEGCNNTWTAWTAGIATPGAYIVTPNFTFQNYVVSKTDVTTKPFTLTYHIKPKAKWSDGRQVTADDFIFTWKTFVDPKNEIASRSGYDSITKAKKINAKTVRFTFNKLLRQKWFRQAIAYSIDRRQMTRQLFRTLTPRPEGAEQPVLHGPAPVVLGEVRQVHAQHQPRHTALPEPRLQARRRRDLVVSRPACLRQARHDRG
jgi:ABC-type transport system substrate-binding protein